MKSTLTSMFGIDVPIFAFSHCRNVVAEVTRAGGLGVLGTSYYGPDALEQELSWIDSQVGDKPYGINLLLATSYERVGKDSVDFRRLPVEHASFVRDLCDEAGIPPLPAAERDGMLDREVAQIHMTPEHAQQLVDVALRHPKIKLFVSALGIPPKEIVDQLHANGIKVGAMTGKVEHALRHKAAGLDLVIAQGSEAAGHTGTVNSMVLWPEVVEAVAPMPVLAAGGIGRGRQMAAAFALGAQGVWCGSIWLGTRESELEPEMKELLFKASSSDTVQTRSRTGKPARMLRSRLTDAWEQPDAPEFLPMPWQTVLNTEPRLRIERARHPEFMTYPVGQIVGLMKEETSVRQVIYDMLEEFGETAQSMGEMADFQ
ncbi:MAG: nitronate monooxygenase family protein [Pseudomonadota bacterium]